jgi:hypothetical protein
MSADERENNARLMEGHAAHWEWMSREFGHPAALERAAQYRRAAAACREAGKGYADHLCTSDDAFRLVVDISHAAPARSCTRRKFTHCDPRRLHRLRRRLLNRERPRPHNRHLLPLLRCRRPHPYLVSLLCPA